MNLSPPPGRIYLLRHAKSGWATPGQRDFDRGLDDEGYAEAEIVTDRAADKGYRPDLVISSTAVRCRETAKAVRRAFPGDLEFRFIDELYNCPTDTYFEILATLSNIESVLMIGHNPAIEEILGELIGPTALGEAVPEGYPTAGFAVIDHAGEPIPDSRHSWRLTDFLAR
ncbi:histidine phosphatase family protein [Rhizobium sp. RU36D]|uniref:SixA phosphatase family protein n=1 Tax=Rhizobium sp. RU36D TaxID=1907415 RepID=UPI0009D7DD92|nr:histidine phosphatase family protein [Rhizobium sp. RU36D]SMC80907.1 phosphohistidine phosphatase [Rhizobium sp. RU36D]